MWKFRIFLFLVLFIEIGNGENLTMTPKSSEDGEPTGENANRLPRSIGNFARLLLGGSYVTVQLGNVPPDHPLVQYPDPIYSPSSISSKVIASVPGMTGSQDRSSQPQGPPQPNQFGQQMQMSGDAPIPSITFGTNSHPFANQPQYSIPSVPSEWQQPQQFNQGSGSGGQFIQQGQQQQPQQTGPSNGNYQINSLNSAPVPSNFQQNNAQAPGNAYNTNQFNNGGGVPSGGINGANPTNGNPYGSSGATGNHYQGSSPPQYSPQQSQSPYGQQQFVQQTYSQPFQGPPTSQTSQGSFPSTGSSYQQPNQYSGANNYNNNPGGNSYLSAAASNNNLPQFQPQQQQQSQPPTNQQQQQFPQPQNVQNAGPASNPPLSSNNAVQSILQAPPLLPPGYSFSSDSRNSNNQNANFNQNRNNNQNGYTQNGYTQNTNTQNTNNQNSYNQNSYNQNSYNQNKNTNPNNFVSGTSNQNNLNSGYPLPNNYNPGGNANPNNYGNYGSSSNYNSNGIGYGNSAQNPNNQAYGNLPAQSIQIPTSSPNSFNSNNTPIPQQPPTIAQQPPTIAQQPPTIAQPPLADPPQQSVRSTSPASSYEPPTSSSFLAAPPTTSNQPGIGFGGYSTIRGGTTPRPLNYVQSNYPSLTFENDGPSIYGNSGYSSLRPEYGPPGGAFSSPLDEYGPPTKVTTYVGKPSKYSSWRGAEDDSYSTIKSSVAAWPTYGNSYSTLKQVEEDDDGSYRPPTPVYKSGKKASSYYRKAPSRYEDSFQDEPSPYRRSSVVSTADLVEALRQKPLNQQSVPVKRYRLDNLNLDFNSRGHKNVLRERQDSSNVSGHGRKHGGRESRDSNRQEAEYLESFKPLKMGRKSPTESYADSMIDTQGLPLQDTKVIPSIAVFHTSYI